MKQIYKGIKEAQLKEPSDLFFVLFQFLRFSDVFEETPGMEILEKASFDPLKFCIVFDYRTLPPFFKNRTKLYSDTKRLED